VREALDLGAGLATLIDRALLEQCYAAAASHDCRKVLIHGVQHLSLWEALRVLLGWAREPPADLRAVLPEAITAWLARSRAGHAPLSEPVREAILEALPAASQEFPRLPWREIHFAMRAA
jgi:hypothetical protein